MNITLKSILPPLDFGWNRVSARCGLSACHNKLLVRSVPQSRSGIHFGQMWYCSVDCLVTAMREPISALCAGRIVEMPRNPRLSLGLAMLSKGLLMEEDLRSATERSRRTGETMEQTLSRMGLADEKRIAAGRAAQWGVPVLASEMAGHRITADLPLTLLDAHGAVLLHYSSGAKRLVLGFVGRVEHSLLQSLEQMTGCRAEPCFVTPTELEEQASRVTATPDYEEVKIDEPESPAAMARTLGYYAVEAGARDVRLIRCNSWIWGRLDGKRRAVDVVFSLKHGVRSGETAVFHESVVTLG